MLGQLLVNLILKMNRIKLDNESNEAYVKTFYSIFNGMSYDEFHEITCKHAKEA